MRCDVAVIGGGPAGSAVALRLARLGHDVIVLERRPASMRRGFAESLAPGVHVHLSTLGIALHDAIEAPAKLLEWRSTVERVEGPLTIVDRAHFDAQLLAAAAQAGARALQPCGLERVERHDSRWTIFAGATIIDAGFVVDASGRAGVLRVKREQPTSRLFASRARWSDVDVPPEMRISVLPDGWMWGVAGPDRSYHICTFVRGESVRDDVPLPPFITRPAEERQVCEATPYVVREPVLDGALIVGDAACAIDPLSSSGVQTALGTAMAASLAIHTLLRAPERAEAARAFYTEHVRRVAARHREWTTAYYSDAEADGVFWRGRATPSQPEVSPPFPRPDARLALKPGARIVAAPVVRGDFIETRRVLLTPRGEHIAYLGEMEVAPLLNGFGAMTAAELAQSWALPPPKAMALLQWLVANDVIGSIDG